MRLGDRQHPYETVKMGWVMLTTSMQIFGRTDRTNAICRCSGHKNVKKNVLIMNLFGGEKDLRISDRSNNCHANTLNNPSMNVDGNISKARRALYSLLGAGLHGHNGLDHKSMLDLYKSFVLSVLTYALEVTRLPTRFRLLTGTYILQVNRSRFNQNAIDASQTNPHSMYEDYSSTYIPQDIDFTKNCLETEDFLVE
ncbi:hypothetical protein DPMN_156793 [Dreissena polymorpha]|uniref:Uncharacterized protein n=1 Tax=Dreissena polymorpha TaxID=45954 RepID=A0A9D4FQE4_DREPO|nr:hypothetical protein DPMN_156793 [Dreissena polymorpha]